MGKVPQLSKHTDAVASPTPSDPLTEKKLEKFKLEQNIPLVHSAAQIKWAKDHIKTKLVYQE
jgi:hypothetical protein